MMHRNPWLDYTKGLACLLIVGHHLAFYGPMSDVLQPLVPALVDWWYSSARMAVQVFLVLGGYLAAAALAPLEPLAPARPVRLLAPLWRRYARLVLPFGAALVVTILVNELVRDWGFEHSSMSAPPSWEQLLAHLLLLHGVGGWESLSAGVWYVAIDFQLYALVAIGAWAQGRWRTGDTGRVSGRVARAWVLPAGLVALTAASLWRWNRDGAWDMWAIYFFGAYGLGMMAWWAARSATAAGRWGWVAAIVVLGGVALCLEWRTRIALALVCALVLATAGALPWPRGLRAWRCAALRRLGQISYSVFLVHFSVCLLVNAVVTLLWPTSLWANAAGVLAAVLLSLMAGAVLYAAVEKRRLTWRQVLGWQAGTLSAGVAITLIFG